MTRRTSGCCLLAVLVTLCCSGSAPAEMIRIQFSGLDIAYDGTDITSATSPDELSSVAISTNGALAGPVLTSDIALEAMIPDVLDIAVGGDTVTSGAGGTFNFSFPSGDSLSLTLGPANINYADAGFVQFTFGAAIAAVNSQSLPYDLLIGDPVAVSFSAQIDSDSLMDDGVNLTAFTASGTGEVRGELVPEPSTLVLLGLATLAIVARRQLR